MKSRWRKLGDYPKAAFINENGNLLTISISQYGFKGRDLEKYVEISFTNASEALQKTCKSMLLVNNTAEIVLNTKLSFNKWHAYANYQSDECKGYHEEEKYYSGAVSSIKYLFDAIDVEYGLDQITKREIYKCADIIAYVKLDVAQDNIYEKYSDLQLQNTSLKSENERLKDRIDIQVQEIKRLQKKKDKKHESYSRSRSIFDSGFDEGSDVHSSRSYRRR